MRPRIPKGKAEEARAGVVVQVSGGSVGACTLGPQASMGGAAAAAAEEEEGEGEGVAVVLGSGREVIVGWVKWGEMVGVVGGMGTLLGVDMQ